MDLRILFVEDSPDDAELMLRRLREADIEPRWDRVQSAGELREALAAEHWDLALVDYNLPGFSGLSALHLLADVAPGVPAITVSGAISEDTAVETITAGAVDYVLKDNLTRLAPAVRRAVEGAELRRKHRRAAEAARLALFAVDHASLSVSTIAADGTIVYVNDFACQSSGLRREQLVGAKLWDIDDCIQEDNWPSVWTEAVEKSVVEFRSERRAPNGRRMVFDVTTNYVQGADMIINYGRDVTSRVEAEEQAHESEAMYRRIVEMAGEGVWAMDGDCRTTFMNSQMAKLLGYEARELLGREVTDLMFDEDLADHRAQMRRRRRGQSGRYLRRFRRRDGSELWTLVHSTAESGPEGEFLGAFGMFTDVTERKLAEDALQAEKANLTAMFEASPVALIVLNAQTAVVRVNLAALRLARGRFESLLEYCPKSVLQCGAALGCAHRNADPRGCGFSPECPLCPLRNGIESALGDGTSLRGVELALELERDGDPQIVWLRMGIEPMSIDGARHVIVALDDITERKRAEESARESEERFEQFATHFPGYLFMHDEKRRYVYVNRPQDEDGDVPREAWLGKTPSQVWDGEDALREETKVQRVLDGELLDVVEPWMPPGLHQYLHSIYFRVPREGKPPLVGGLSVDVTEQVEAQVEVRRQAEQLRRTVEGAVLAMSHMVESRDPYTAGHERRVAELAVALAAAMGVDGEALEALRLAALIHDIGKIAVPAEILAKPGRLSAVEFNLIKQHPASGFEILEAIDFGRPVAEIVLQHHERLDGSGYPRGLPGEEILPEARILAVADVLEAMSSHRPYRATLGMEAALAEIREHAGEKYDAEVAAVCFRLVEEEGFRFTP